MALPIRCQALAVDSRRPYSWAAPLAASRSNRYAESAPEHSDIDTAASDSDTANAAIEWAWVAIRQDATMISAPSIIDWRRPMRSAKTPVGISTRMTIALYRPPSAICSENDSPRAAMNSMKIGTYRYDVA